MEKCYINNNKIENLELKSTALEIKKLTMGLRRWHKKKPAKLKTDIVIKFEE